LLNSGRADPRFGVCDRGSEGGHLVDGLLVLGLFLGIVHDTSSGLEKKIRKIKKLEMKRKIGKF
jgi:hypothetical protein